MNRYDKTQWVHKATLVSADNLNKIENQLESLTNESIKISSQMDKIETYDTPLMYGAVNSLGENCIDCINELQKCYNETKTNIVDLMGKTWYISSPIKLNRTGITFRNGKIISRGNTFENDCQWCHSHKFINMSIRSLNGYCFYIVNNNYESFNSEFYDTYFKNLILISKLGGYYAPNTLDCQIGFSLVFEDIWVKTENGHGITGVKSPGSRMTHIVNEGHPNGALISNCFCPIEIIDSNQIAKYGLYYENYFNGDVITLKNCNFEHIKNQGVVLKTGGLKIDMENIHFTKTYNNNEKVNTEGFYFESGTSLTLKNIDFNGFNYGDNYVDILMNGNPVTDITNKVELKIKNTSYYTNHTYTLTQAKGLLGVNHMGINNSMPYQTYNNTTLIYDTTIQNMYYPSNKKTVSIDEQKLLLINDVLGNNFNITDNNITIIHGIREPINFELGNCTLISISNNTGSDLTLTNNHWLGRKFIFKDGQDKVLTNTNSIIFIVKDNTLYELY